METQFILSNAYRTVLTSFSDYIYRVMFIPRLAEAIVTMIR